MKALPWDLCHRNNLTTLYQEGTNSEPAMGTPRKQENSLLDLSVYGRYLNNNGVLLRGPQNPHMHFL